VQKLLYVGIILVIVIQVVSGWVIWKPMQLSELTRLFYDFQGARLVHFIGMAAIVLFLVIHVALALLVPKTIGAMVTGGPPEPEAKNEPASGTPLSAPAE
jgi:thiosulfate reductase cytochrome b subunit